MTDEEIINEWNFGGCSLEAAGFDAVVTFARAIIAAERERWLEMLTKQANHMAENASALRKFPEQEAESRARELAASYMRDLVWAEKAKQSLGDIAT